MLAVPVSVMFSMPDWFVPAAENVTEELTRSRPSIRRQLDHDIADVVDSVGVIADTSGHAIGARAAIQCVVAVSAVEGVIPAVAEQLVVAVPAGEDIAPSCQNVRSCLWR